MRMLSVRSRKLLVDLKCYILWISRKTLLQFVFVSDASLVGGGGWICQGETLERARPAVYHSRVFNPAQSNYPVHEEELLTLQDLVKSCEHWLIG
jgi:hypothetical protein